MFLTFFRCSPSPTDSIFFNMTSTVRLLQSLNLQLQTVSFKVFPGTSLPKINDTFGSFGSSCAFFVDRPFLWPKSLGSRFLRATAEFSFGTLRYLQNSSPSLDHLLLSSWRRRQLRPFFSGIMAWTSPPSLVFIIWAFPIIICTWMSSCNWLVACSSSPHGCCRSLSASGSELSSSYLQN